MPKLLAHLPKPKTVNHRVISKFRLGATRTKWVTQKAKFTEGFMHHYVTAMVKYFNAKTKEAVYKSHFDLKKNRQLVREWFEKMKETDPAEFPFPIEEIADRSKYMEVPFWRSVINTLIGIDEFKVICTYTQTTQGIFMYVQNGRYFSDLRKQRQINTECVVSAHTVTRLKVQDFRNIIGVFCALAYELSVGKEFKKTKNFYKYAGFRLDLNRKVFYGYR